MSKTVTARVHEFMSLKTGERLDPSHYESIWISKQNGEFHIMEKHSGWKQRNQQLLKLLIETHETLGLPDFEPILFWTNDLGVAGQIVSETSKDSKDRNMLPVDRSRSYRKYKSRSLGYVAVDNIFLDEQSQEEQKKMQTVMFYQTQSENLAIPDFMFDSCDFLFGDFKDNKIPQYDDMTADIFKAGQSPPETNKLGWIGRLETSPFRRTLFELGQNNKELMDILDSESHTYVSLPDQIRRYTYMIDIEGWGYSGRIKLLLFSGRTLFLQQRPWVEWYHAMLEPWVHYVPVKRDLSDLKEKLQMIRLNPEFGIKIGRAGLEFARKHLTKSNALLRFKEVISRFADNNMPPDKSHDKSESSADIAGQTADFTTNGVRATVEAPIESKRQTDTATASRWSSFLELWAQEKPRPQHDDLVGLVAHCGLFPYTDGTKREFPDELYRDCGKGMGLWQYPAQFAPYLHFLATSIGDIHNYLEIGVAAGGTYMLTTEFLRRTHKNMTSVGLDVVFGGAQYLSNDASAPKSPFQGVLEEYMQWSETYTQFVVAPSADLWKHYKPKKQKKQVACKYEFDVALIDGDHSYGGVRADFELIRDFTRVVVFHDIVNDVCPGVVRFWQELSHSEQGQKEYTFHEFTSQYSSVAKRTGQSFLGIGVAVRKETVKHEVVGEIENQSEYKSERKRMATESLRICGRQDPTHPRTETVDSKSCYAFTNSWFDNNIANFQKHLAHLASKEAHVLEIGSHEGKSACWMLDNILDHEKSTITCVDPYLSSDTTTPVSDQTLRLFKSNIKQSKHPSKCSHIHARSVDALPTISSRKFDMIYVDGSHLAEDVLYDAVMCWTMVKKNGLLWFDDFGNHDAKEPWKHVRIAIYSFLSCLDPKSFKIHVNAWQLMIEKL